MSHEELEHRSAPVLTKEHENGLRAATTRDGPLDAVHSAGVLAWRSIWATLDAARAERDAALAEVARMRPVVEAALAMKDCRDHADWVRVAPRIGNPDNAAQARRADNDRVLDKFYFAVQVYREQAAKEVQP